MKLFKSRKLSIVLALVLVLTSLSFTAMAADGDVTAPAEDFSIISTAKNLKDITNAQTGLSEEYLIATDKSYVDPLTGETVVRYSATKYGTPSDSGQNWNTAGGEPRSAINTLLAKADYSNDKYGYLRIAFDIYIASATDGIAFRMERFSTETSALIEKTYHYVAVGGADFAAGTATHKYVNNDLKAGAWNNVVIELGANSTNKDVIFHINGVSTVCETQLPDNTYGFGGSSVNRGVMIPKGAREAAFEIRLNNFSIVATNTKPDFHIFNNEYFVTGSFIDRSGTLSREQVNAKEFAESYNKKALNLKNLKTTGLTGGAGQEAGFKLNTVSGEEANKNDQQSLGGLDWSQYKNLRIQFNAYFGYENIIFFRTVRSVDGSFDYTNNSHVIGIGTPAKPGGNSGTANTGSATSGCSYKYREMTPNQWHNVVMELGANKDNKYINIYIDGKKVTSSELAAVFTNGDTAEGFGTVGASRLVLAVRDTTDSILDVQLSDISFTACNSTYTPDAAPTINGVVRGSDSTGGLSYRVDTENKAITYVADRDTDGMSVADFKVSNVDYVAPTDATNTKAIVYDDSSKRVAYYTLSEQTDVVLDGIQAEAKDDGRLYVQFDYNNQTEEDDAFKLYVGYYNEDALVYVTANTWCPIPKGLSASSYDLSMPKLTTCDKIKVFAWGNTVVPEGEKPLTIIPMIKSAEIEVVK